MTSMVLCSGSDMCSSDAMILAKNEEIKWDSVWHLKVKSCCWNPNSN